MLVVEKLEKGRKVRRC